MTAHLFPSSIGQKFTLQFSFTDTSGHYLCDPFLKSRRKPQGWRRGALRPVKIQLPPDVPSKLGRSHTEWSLGTGVGVLRWCFHGVGGRHKPTVVTERPRSLQLLLILTPAYVCPPGPPCSRALPLLLLPPHAAFMTVLSGSLSIFLCSAFKAVWK